jgi:hypothetical protein
METVVKVAVVVGGLVFSFAIALLIEELIFGQVFRMVFGAKPVLATQEVNAAASQIKIRSTSAS